MTITEWAAMVVAEPELAALEADVIAYAEATRTRDEWERELVWARAFKPRLERLVGWHARLGCLQSSAAYHAAYSRLYDRLMATAHHLEEATR